MVANLPQLHSSLQQHFDQVVQLFRDASAPSFPSQLQSAQVDTTQKQFKKLRKQPKTYWEQHPEFYMFLSEFRAVLDAPLDEAAPFKATDVGLPSLAPGIYIVDAEQFELLGSGGNPDTVLVTFTDDDRLNLPFQQEEAPCFRIFA